MLGTGSVRLHGCSRVFSEEVVSDDTVWLKMTIFSVLLVSASSETLELRPTLLYNIIYFVYGFPLTPK